MCRRTTLPAKCPHEIAFPLETPILRVGSDAMVPSDAGIEAARSTREMFRRVVRELGVTRLRTTAVQDDALITTARARNMGPLRDQSTAGKRERRDRSRRPLRG